MGLVKWVASDTLCERLGLSTSDLHLMHPWSEVKHLVFFTLFAVARMLVSLSRMEGILRDENY